MNESMLDDRIGEIDVHGFVSHAGHALGECMDAAGIDWRLEDRTCDWQLD